MSNLKKNGIDALSLTGGLVAGHIAQKTFLKKDNALIHGGMAAGGLILSTICKSDLLKMAAMGMAAYGTIRLIHKTVAPAVAPASPSVAAAMYGVNGMEGLLPESLKAKIRQFVPSIGNTDYEIMGADEGDLTGYEELTGDEDLSGDYEEVNGYISGDDYEEVRGIGNAAQELI